MLKFKESIMSRSCDIYIDADGNKVVEPIFNGNGCVGGMIGVKK